MTGNFSGKSHSRLVCRVLIYSCVLLSTSVSWTDSNAVKLKKECGQEYLSARCGAKSKLICHGSSSDIVACYYIENNLRCTCDNGVYYASVKGKMVVLDTKPNNGWNFKYDAYSGKHVLAWITTTSYLTCNSENGRRNKAFVTNEIESATSFVEPI